MTGGRLEKIERSFAYKAHTPPKASNYQANKAKMPGNDLWTPMRVKNFMRELELVPTKWEENIVALAEQGRMTVEEFLATDPITFGEKIWGKCKNVYHKNKVWDILGERTYYEMLGAYYRAPAQVAAQAYMDAKVAAIKEQKALGLTSYMSVSAEDKAGWERVFAENKAMESLEAAEEATREAEVAKAAVLAELDQEKAAEQQSKLAKEAVEAVKLMGKGCGGSLTDPPQRWRA